MMTSVSDHLAKLPEAVRPIVQSARRVIKETAPKVKEIAYQSAPPRSSRAMWKIVRYTLDDEYVAAIGTFPTYATLFFPRGRELDVGDGLLEGSGKQMRFIRLRTRADAERPAVKTLLRRAFRLAERSR